MRPLTTPRTTPRALCCLGLALLLTTSAVPAQTQAEVDVRIHVNLPAAPPLVVVQPGVQVVEDWDDEVFYTRGFYWVRRGPRWYRSHRTDVPFVLVERRHVPVVIYREPPGRYRRWKRQHARAERHERHERRGGRREDRREDRRARTDDDRREHRARGQRSAEGGPRRVEAQRPTPRPVVTRAEPRPAHRVAPAPGPGPHDAPGRNPSPGPHDARR